MSDLEIRTIREALASSASSAAGVKRALSYLPDKIAARDLPLVVVGNPAIAYNRGFGRGRATLTIPVFALVSEGLPSAKGTELLDRFVSLQLATSAAPATLGEALRQERATELAPWVVNVTEVSEYTLFQFESAQYYGVQFTAVVTT